MPEPLKINCRNCHCRLDVSDFEPFTLVECPGCGTHLRVPKPFGRYQLEKVCGTGGTSVIYRAIDPVLARRVAVKIVSEEDADADFAERFRAEARLVGKLNHPGIVPIYDCGALGKQFYLVMQFMEKGDLERMMKAGSLPSLPRLLNQLLTVTGALDYAIREGVVHHDIKPSNILISASDDAKLGDFDLADLRKAGDLDTPCAEWGSPGYMSPERIYSGGEDGRGDVFSLGVTIYELLSGRTPFGISGAQEELYRRRQAGSFPPLNELNAAVSREFAGLVGAMLAFKPEDRPDCRRIADGLQAEINRLENPEAARWTGRLSDWFRKTPR